MPYAGAAADRYVGALNQAMTAHGINTPAQRAAFLAQVAVESDELRSTTERLNYSAGLIHQVWPGRFPTEAAATPYAHNPEALANRAYAGVNDNSNETSGDGYRLRGRGLIQSPAAAPTAASATRATLKPWRCREALRTVRRRIGKTVA